MLTVLIEHNGEVVYLKPFLDHKEAIDHLCELFGHTYNDAVLSITSLETILMGRKPKIPYYVR